MQRKSSACFDTAVIFACETETTWKDNVFTVEYTESLILGVLGRSGDGGWEGWGGGGMGHLIFWASLVGFRIHHWEGRWISWEQESFPVGYLPPTCGDCTALMGYGVVHKSTSLTGLQFWSPDVTSWGARVSQHIEVPYPSGGGGQGYKWGQVHHGEWSHGPPPL